MQRRCEGMGKRTAIVGFGVLAVGTLVGVLAARAISADHPNGNLNTYAIFAAQELNTRTFHVLSGNIGVNAGRMVLHGDVEAPNSELTADTLVFFDGPQCHPGQLFANHPSTGPCGDATPFNGSILPSNLEVEQACDFPPAVTCSTDPSKSITIAAGASMELIPGIYGDVTVQSETGVLPGGDLILDPGDYVFCNLAARQGVRILVGGPVNIQVNGTAMIGNDSFVGPLPGRNVGSVAIMERIRPDNP